MSSVLPIEFLIDDLAIWKYIHISPVPELPRNEWKYTLKKHHHFKTHHGDLLVLELIKVDDNTEFTISLPDIKEIRLNDHSNSQMHKYYIECTVRLLDYKLKNMNGEQRLGFDPNEIDNEVLIDNSGMTYRIILTER
jgi:hypothetical protein